VATQDSRITPGRWETAAVDDDAVRSALREVGAQPPDDLHAERHPVIMDIIRVRVAGGAPVRHVWLRTTPTVHVLGAAPTAEPATAGTQIPAATERPTS
jgi:hypothetical protein